MYSSRNELVEILDLPRVTVASFERAHALEASKAGQFSTNSRVQYDNVDVGSAICVARVYRYGSRGAELAKVWRAAQSKRKRLVGGFSGWLLVDRDGDGELAGSADALGQLLDQVADQCGAFVVPLRVAPPDVDPKTFYSIPLFSNIEEVAMTG